MKKTQAPTVTKSGGPVSDTVEKHPAYGQIHASRVSGGIFLYGSDFNHQHFIRIGITTSELHRGLSNDYHFARDHLIEVSLSEAQWATFVSSLNHGSGVPCTINHIKGEQIPELPFATDRHKQIKEEAQDRMKVALEALSGLRASIESSKLSGKQQKEFLSQVDRVRMNIAENLQFVADQFDEHVEKTIEHAKVEIGAYVTSTIARAGIKAMNGEVPFSLALQAPKETPDVP
jgi:hypothetical protein